MKPKYAYIRLKSLRMYNIRDPQLEVATRINSCDLQIICTMKYIKENTSERIERVNIFSCEV